MVYKNHHCEFIISRFVVVALMSKGHQMFRGIFCPGHSPRETPEGRFDWPRARVPEEYFICNISFVVVVLALIL